MYAAINELVTVVPNLRQNVFACMTTFVSESRIIFVKHGTCVIYLYFKDQLVIQCWSYAVENKIYGNERKGGN